MAENTQPNTGVRCKSVGFLSSNFPLQARQSRIFKGNRLARAVNTSVESLERHPSCIGAGYH